MNTGKILLDENSRPYSALDSYNITVCRPVAFTGGTANSRGDDGGTNDPFTLFTVTGDVIVRIYGVVTTTLTGATATVALGTANNTGGIIAATTATDLAANDVWVDATPTEVELVALASIPAATVITNGADIVETVATADITAGNIYYVCLWRPVASWVNAAGVSTKANVIAAGTQL